MTTIRPFPADFLWGAAAAAYQIEGAVDGGPRRRCVRPCEQHEAEGHHREQLMGRLATADPTQSEQREDQVETGKDPDPGVGRERHGAVVDVRSGHPESDERRRGDRVDQWFRTGEQVARPAPT